MRTGLEEQWSLYRKRALMPQTQIKTHRLKRPATIHREASETADGEHGAAHDECNEEDVHVNQWAEQSRQSNQAVRTSEETSAIEMVDPDASAEGSQTSFQPQDTAAEVPGWPSYDRQDHVKILKLADKKLGAILTERN